MKVLSVQQPWASMICAGIKDVENRTWKPQENPGKILIHASKKFTKNTLADMPWEWAAPITNHMNFGNLPDAADYPYGAIIGYATLDSIVTEYRSIWAVPDKEQYKWVLKDAYLFDEPITGVKGKLRLFDYDLDEDNLPPAHKVEVRMPKREGDELVIPLTKEIWEWIATVHGEGENDFVDFEISNDIVDTLCKPDVYDLLPIQSIRFEHDGESLRFEVDGPSSVSVLAADENGNPLPYLSLLDPEKPVNRPICRYFLNKRLGNGEKARHTEWPIYDNNEVK